MSIPLKAICGAATLAFALTPGIREAHAAEHTGASGALPEESGGEQGMLSPPSRGRRPVLGPVDPIRPGKGGPAGPPTVRGAEFRPDHETQDTHPEQALPPQAMPPHAGPQAGPEHAAPAQSGAEEAEFEQAEPGGHAGPLLPAGPTGPISQGGLHGRGMGAHLHAQALAWRQRAARAKRARLIAQWQGRADRAVNFAMAQRGKPYRWGGTGPYGYDCSGLVQRAWRRAGVTIPRVTHDQYRGIRKKVQRRNLRPGDLLLFNGLRHVGMYVGDGRFVHAPRPGRSITTERLRGYYARSYVGAVRPAWPRLPEIPTH
ncbi:C40 family peptidase [Thermomonospora umbrina]|uniref:NlpC/P60 family protein n=1 Tax=Thermomonospora umbrina TaxID=111806 RepID=A0A3D9T3V3_9ACTN|nr:C40 family peptidase [Thermomonospora umbrina]REE98491.1 NlpC/P60 family protein [Thermomonospora umbrina]